VPGVGTGGNNLRKPIVHPFKEANHVYDVEGLAQLVNFLNKICKKRYARETSVSCLVPDLSGFFCLNIVTLKLFAAIRRRLQERFAGPAPRGEGH